MTLEFLITALIVVLLPGTGVIYTVSVGLTRSARASVFAAGGCTLGIVPHLCASAFGVAALLHTSAVAFQIFKFIGVLYLAFLAWQMWRESGELSFDAPSQQSHLRVAVRGLLINVLNPKLSIFFLAFLPQFVDADGGAALVQMLELSGVFMAMTFAVFVGYGQLANRLQHLVTRSPSAVQTVQRVFAGVFVALGAKLALSER